MGNYITSNSSIEEIIEPGKADQTTCTKQKYRSRRLELGELLNYEYPFENLVFEGGGNKGIAYYGGLLVLEKLHILPKVKRFAGTSAGAMIAALLSVGYGVNDILEFLSVDIGELMTDHKYGYFSLVPNLVLNYGWNSGQKVNQWLGGILSEKTGNADITFLELYKQSGRELCILVTNVNLLAAVYCHPKTTPHMSIRLAIRMSMAIPGMFAPIRYGPMKGKEQYYVDGGVLCNYPIHCFDGWWLSMEKSNTFLNRVRPLNNLLKFFDKSFRFGTFNEKTIGFVLFSEDEPDIMRTHLEDRLREYGCEGIGGYPETILSKKRKVLGDCTYKECEIHREICCAFDKLMTLIANHNPDNRSTINFGILADALKDYELTDNDQLVLFGKVIQCDEDVRDIFNMLDINANDEIEILELVNFLDTKGIDIQSRFLGYHGREIDGFQSFMTAVTNTMLTQTKRSFMEDRDKHRTVGINTGYIDTTDFTLEDGDREFLVTQGWNGSVAFFKEYCKREKEYLKKRKNQEMPQSPIQIKIDEVL